MPLKPFQARPTKIDGLFIVEMKQISDERGVVREFYRESDFVGAGLSSLGRWVQMNLTATSRGAIRGLHGEATSKFVSVAAGSAFGVYLDARSGSPTFGSVVTVDLEPGLGVLVGEGICNGFQATAPGETEYMYCFDHEWVPDMAGVSVDAFDSALAIAWPIPVDPSDRRLVSEKDAGLPLLEALADKA